MRIEKDQFGEVEIEDDALYGIQALRSSNNFPINKKIHFEWYKAMGDVKKAYYLSIKNFYQQIDLNKKEIKREIRKIPQSVLDSLIKAASEISDGTHFENMIVPSITGGAGTSINMNINEIITNRALQLEGYNLGDYSFIDPYNDANCYQSTNDTVPTALKLAIMRQLDVLQESINSLRFELEQLEKKNFNLLRIGFTQLQEAVPTSVGRLISSYNEALSRDWWRVSKAKERIKSINLGGGAVGTALGIPTFIVFEAPKQLRDISSQPLTRAENLSDATSNQDDFVEMHSIMKTVAVNLEKIASDIRLLSSDISGQNRLFKIPSVQVGSSIMPQKVNPVISEFVISCSRKVLSNDQLISSLAASGTLELNAYLPTLGDAILESLDLLIASCNSLNNNMIKGIIVDEKNSYEALIHSPSITTALIPTLGYKVASEVASLMKKNKISIFEANNLIKLIPQKVLENILKPENLLSLGFSVKS